MKAILLDAANGRITEASPKDWSEYKDLIGHGCDLFTVACYLPNGDALLIDDEGLLKNIGHAIKVPWYPAPLMGNGLIVGTGPDGETADCKSEADMKLADAVEFGRVAKVIKLGATE